MPPPLHPACPPWQTVTRVPIQCGVCGGGHTFVPPVRESLVWCAAAAPLLASRCVRVFHAHWCLTAGRSFEVMAAGAVPVIIGPEAIAGLPFKVSQSPCLSNAF